MLRTLRIPILRLVACLLLGALEGFAQSLPATVQEGVVRDAQGRPIVGAQVCVEPRWTDQHQHWSRDDALTLEPFPVVVTNAEGRFTLPLSDAQRGFSGDEWGYVLVAEKVGHRPWRQLMPSPLASWRGATITLPSSGPDDLGTVRVLAPEAGMLVAFRRLPSPRNGPPYAGTASLSETILCAPDATGAARAPIPLLPNPVVLENDDVLVPLGWTAELWFPGRTTAPAALRVGQKLELRASDSAKGSLALASKDGKELTGVRALCRCPDRRLRWFLLPTAAVPVDPLLPVVAVAASGHAAALVPTRVAEERVALDPLPRAPAGALLALADEDGARARPSRAWLYPLEAWGDAAGCAVPRAFYRPLRTISARDDGRLPLADLPDEPAFLLVEGAGFVRTTVLEPRTLRGEVQRTLRVPKHETVQVRVVDPSGAPVAGQPVAVYASSSETVGGNWQGAAVLPPRTDADGVAWIEGVPARESHQVIVLSPDESVVQCRDAPHAREGDGHEVVVTAVRCKITELRIVDAEHKPVPYAPLLGAAVSTRVADGEMIVPSGGPWLSDEQGRVHVSTQSTQETSITEGMRGLRTHRSWRLTKDLVPELTVHHAPAILLRVPYGTVDVVEATLVGKAVPFAGLRLPVGQDSEAWLLRIAAGSGAMRAFFVPGAPPIVVGPRDLEGKDLAAAASAPIEIDRREVARRVPVQLRGAVPGDAAAWRAEPIGIGGARLPFCVPGECASRAPDGGLELRFRDGYAHRVRLMHPECLPIEVDVPDSSSEPLAVEVKAGTPWSANLSLDKAPGPGWPATFDVMVEEQGRWFGGLSIRAVLDDRTTKRLASEGKHTVQAPFALAPGSYRVQVTAMQFGGTDKKEVTIQAGKPASIDLGPLH